MCHRAESWYDLSSITSQQVVTFKVKIKEVHGLRVLLTLSYSGLMFAAMQEYYRFHCLPDILAETELLHTSQT